MSDVGDAISEARAEIASACDEFLTNTCNLIAYTKAAEPSGGTTETAGTPSADIPYSFEVLSRPIEQRIAGSGITSLTHKLKFPHTETTRAIRPNYKIVDKNDASLIWEHPTNISGSMDVFLFIAASLKVS